MNADNFSRVAISFFQLLLSAPDTSKLRLLLSSLNLSAFSMCGKRLSVKTLVTPTDYSQMCPEQICLPFLIAAVDYVIFLFKCDLKACAAASGVVGGRSPEAVFLSHVNKLVCVRVWGAVVVRSLHVFDPSSPPGLMDWWMDGWWIWTIFSTVLSAAWRRHTDDRLPSRRSAHPVCPSLCFSRAPTYKSLVVLSYFLSLVFVFVSFLHVSPVLSSVSQHCHLIDPQGPMATKKNHKLL